MQGQASGVHESGGSRDAFVIPGAATQPAEHAAHEHPDDAPRQPMIPGQQVSQPCGMVSTHWRMGTSGKTWTERGHHTVG
jgi:hypothetical protein